MSSRTSKKIDQKEYLKKYLSGDTNKKKKKVKKHKLKDSVKVKIIDDDANANTELDIDEELLLTGEDAPQIVGSYIEENPSGVVEPKWKSIVIKDEEEEDEHINVKPRIKLEEDLWGPKAIDRRIKDAFSPVRTKSPTSDNLPAIRGRDDGKATSERRQRTRSCSKDRKKKRDNVTNENSYTSPPRKKGNKRTPPREMYQRNNRSERISTERMRRSLSSDQSPPRRKIRGNHTDQIPRRRKSSCADQSPTRRRNRSSIDNSPPRKRNVDLQDQSPPRRRRRGSDDQSPPRKQKTDLSPPQRRAPSPVKIKREKESPDFSPTRRRNRCRERESRMKYKLETSSRCIKKEPSIEKRSRWEPREPSHSLSPPPTHGKKTMTKTLDGKRAGLQDAESLKKENQEFRRREDEFFAKMSSEMSGRDAEVQVRNEGRRGRRARQAKELDPEEELRKEAHEKKKKELYESWGKGLKQIEAHRTKVDQDQYESSKPLARYSNDADLEQHLREQERPDDPMLDYMRKKHKDKQKNTNVPTLPTYQGPFPENRFGLRPGYRWDGVDRSNGYEKKWFDKQNEKRAVQDEAYKYSVEDM